MKFLNPARGKAHLGLAFGPGTLEFAKSHLDIVDYIELPFEQLQHSPSLSQIQESVPLLLHCASMSIAGFVAPSNATIEAIARQAVNTGTPWIGEHLAFVLADGLSDELETQSYVNSLTYTVCPQLSEETVRRVAQNLEILRPQFSAPLILENSPQYFTVPGSTMSMTQFIREVVSLCDVNLLLDLSHFLVTARNTNADVFIELDGLPLERITEVHISGLSVQSGIAWDDHASPAPPVVFELLARVLERVLPQAVTFEYNWSPTFPTAIIDAHIQRARELLDLAC
jgi:hypothetical protein